MAEKYLIVVDMQNDVTYDALGTQEAQAIVDRVVQKVQNFSGKVIYTLDTHQPDYMETQEGKMLPVPHCIKDTHGWQLIDPLLSLQKQNNNLVFEKGTFGSVDLAQYIVNQYKQGNVESVELIGVCTDICVISNALLIKAYLPELQIYVDSACCAGVTTEKHNAAIETLKSCQIIVE